MNYRIKNIGIIIFTFSLSLFGEQEQARDFLFKIRNAADFFMASYFNATSCRYRQDSCFVELPPYFFKKIKNYEDKLLKLDSIIVKTKFITCDFATNTESPALVLTFQFEKADGSIVLFQKQTIDPGTGLTLPVSADAKFFNIVEIHASEVDDKDNSPSGKEKKRGDFSIYENREDISGSLSSGEEIQNASFDNLENSNSDFEPPSTNRIENIQNFSNSLNTTDFNQSGQNEDQNFGVPDNTSSMSMDNYEFQNNEELGLNYQK